MRRLWILTLLFLASCVAPLPAIGVWCWRQRINAAWEDLLKDMQALQNRRDRVHRVAVKNAQWKASRQQVDFSDWIAKGEQLVFLNREREAVGQLPITTWVGRSREIKDRQAFLQDNRLFWEEKELGSHHKLFSLRKKIQVEGEDLPSLLKLFDLKDPQIPLVFLSYWEMTRQTSSLGNEVWVVHAEAWGRCL